MIVRRNGRWLQEADLGAESRAIDTLDTLAVRQEDISVPLLINSLSHQRQRLPTSVKELKLAIFS